jgi:hypothetical protein
LFSVCTKREFLTRILVFSSHSPNRFGSTVRLELRTTLAVRHVAVVNILEEPVEEDVCKVEVDPADSRVVRATFTPFRLLTLKLTLVA